MKFILLSACVLLVEPLLAENGLKKAFAEGIKASIDVVKHEKSQASKPIQEGYCVTVMGREHALDIWEEVKLESLALFLKLKPSLLASKNSSTRQKRILCLSIVKEKTEAFKTLQKIKQSYPKIDGYISKVEILVAGAMQRVIPGVGVLFEKKELALAAEKQMLKPSDPLHGRIVMLSEVERGKVMFDNGSTRVVSTSLKDVSYVEHTVYRRK